MTTVGIFAWYLNDTPIWVSITLVALGMITILCSGTLARRVHPDSRGYPSDRAFFGYFTSGMVLLFLGGAPAMVDLINFAAAPHLHIHF